MATNELPPIYNAPEEEQVDLLAQALLREYMHKKKFKGTLKQFDVENPRNEKTVTSRAVMNDLMLLNEKLPEFKEQGIDTLMEALCAIRVDKRVEEETREERKKAAAAANAEPPLTEEEQQMLRELGVEEGLTPEQMEAKILQLEAETQQNNAEAEAALKEAEEIDAAIARAWAKAEKKAKKAQQTLDRERKKKKKESKAGSGDGDGGKKRHKLMTIDEILEKETPTTASSSAQPTPTSAQRKQQQAAASSSSSSSAGGGSDKDNDDDEDDEDEDDYMTALKNIANKSKPSIAVKRPSFSGEGGAGVGDDDENGEDAESAAPIVKRQGWGDDGALDNDDDDDDHHTANIDPSSPEDIRAAARAAAERMNKQGGGKQQQQQAPPKKQKEPEEDDLPAGSLGHAAAQELMKMLMPTNRGIPKAFIQQGFCFDSDIPYGLLQHAGGPCGVLAVVQAFCLKHIFHASSAAKQTQIDRVTPLQAERALVASIAEILVAAASFGPKKNTVRLVHSPPQVLSTTTKSADQQKLIAACQVEEIANGIEGVEAALTRDDNTLLAEWMEPHGLGLLCFTLSLLLTRGGAQAVKSAMDAPSDTLIGSHGYCTQEITNLALSGSACTNTTDDDTSQDGFVLHGLSHRPTALEVGFLSMMDHLGYSSVQSKCKNPKYPIWVVYNESHYTVLFCVDPFHNTETDLLKEPSAQRQDVYYWDQQGGQTEHLKISLTLDGVPIPAKKKDDSTLVPYIEHIVHTRRQWGNAKLDWNGNDPLL